MKIDEIRNNESNISFSRLHIRVRPANNAIVAGFADKSSVTF